MFDPFAQSTPRIFNISPVVSFVDHLAATLLKQTQEAPEKLADYLILLPTRRACRSLREAFLRQTDGKPLLLPRMQPLGDVDADELLIHGALCESNLSIPPAISSVRRQILLSRLIGGIADYSRGLANDMKLAAALGQLMDQIYTENLNLSILPELIDREELASHWQITTDFLKILSEAWPAILAEEGMIDAADRRNRLMKVLDQYWQKSPPQHPVIAAGSTASIPVTADLLKTIASLPQGAVILPGVDTFLTEDVWDSIEEGHPQATLKNFLNHADVSHKDVFLWDYEAQEYQKDHLAAQIMLPAEKTNQWQSVDQKTEKWASLFDHMTQYDCETQQDEAKLIAILLREALETPGKTAALVTPDRYLANRVQALCQRWNIDIDDSAGLPLDQTSVGLYFRLCVEAVNNKIDLVLLLSLLKHPLAANENIKNYRQLIRQLDRNVMRGFIPCYDWNYFIERSVDISPDLQEVIVHLSSVFETLSNVLLQDKVSFIDLLDAHICVAETLCDQSILWSGEEGEALSAFLFTLREEAEHIGLISPQDYLESILYLMKAVTVRPKYGTHPRISILGQLEARLIQADRVILSGLNEGTWPADNNHDPWMSQPMRQKFGLPASERGTTLSAHDFVQGFCAKEVFMTRAMRVDGAPTNPSRWLTRFHTFMEAVQISDEVLKRGSHLQYATMMDDVDDIQSIDRPAPTPPVVARPTQLSVTKIETWIRDPYSLYAGKILRLNPLDPIDKELDVSDRGMIIHDILDQWVTAHKDDIADTILDDFIFISCKMLDEYGIDVADKASWMPRLHSIGEWILNHEKNWQKQAFFHSSEVTGKVTVADNFILTARADRIDQYRDGTYALVDYKSGGQFTIAGLKTAKNPQLPLEAFILNHGGFDDIEGQTSYLGYWKVTGGAQAGQITAIDTVDVVNESVEKAHEGLKKLIEQFNKEETPYLSLPRSQMIPRYNDYLYLARVKEWSALDDTLQVEAA